MRKLNKKNLIKHQRTIIFILLFLVVSTMTIGYASFNEILSTTGLVTIQVPEGNLEITAASLTSNTNTNTATVTSYSDLTANFRIRFNRNRNGTAVYSITITNNTRTDYTYNGFTFNQGNSNYTAAVTGISSGDTIASRSSVTVTVTITGRQNNNTNYTPSITFSLEDQPTGNVIGILNDQTTDISTNTLGPVEIIVYNTYSVDKVVSFTQTNPHFYLVDENENDLGNIIIPANSNSIITAYIKKDPEVLYLTNSDTTHINMYSDNKSTSLGEVTVIVPVSSPDEDTEKPQIGNVTLDVENTEGSFTTTWTRADSGGTDIDSYTILLYTENSSSPVDTQTVPANQTSYTFTNKSEDNYYVKVYATDLAGNSGAEYEENDTTYYCTTPGYTNDYCKQSATKEMKWTFTVTNNIANTTLGTTTAKRGQTYTSTLRGNNNYTINANSIEVTMNGETVNHTYANNTITVENVTGPIIITGTSSNGCLVEGTRILLADGTYKNIEDIEYTDLLQVWNYETGTITYEYPIWIEKSYQTDSYEQTTFSDGTVLKTVKLHQVFSLDENKFVNILDGDYIKVGTNVAKVENGKIKPVQVTKVETINETVNYYFVASSIYYNIISEDLITTSDQITKGVTLSNMYGFEENIKWPSIRKDIINQPGALFTYEELNIMPYYLYYGSRGYETKLFVNLGYATPEDLINYLLTNQLNPSMMITPPTNKEGNRLWMVTTSEDLVTENNKKEFLYEEGTEYTLQEPLNTKDFIGWYNTTDEKIYQPGDTINVILGTHFIAQYKR